MATGHRTAILRRPRRLELVLGIALLSTIGIGAGQLSLALFADQETVAATFGTGSVELDESAIDQLTLAVDAMMPGDAATDDVVVHNVGTGELRYALSTSSTNTDANGLRDVLVLTVKTADATTPGSPCDNFDGATLVSSTALGASGAGFGDAAGGADTGDRTLAAGASETLCFRVALPVATGDSYEGAETTTTFTFAAEQTANNP